MTRPGTGFFPETPAEEKQRWHSYVEPKANSEKNLSRFRANPAAFYNSTAYRTPLFRSRRLSRQYRSTQIARFGMKDVCGKIHVQRGICNNRAGRREGRLIFPCSARACRVAAA